MSFVDQTVRSIFRSGYTLLSNFDRQNQLQTRARQCLTTYFSNRKLVFGTLLGLMFLLYFWPSSFSIWRSGPSDYADSVSSSCLNAQLAQFQPAYGQTPMQFTRHAPRRPGDPLFIPFIGNGHLGMALGDGKQQLRIRSDKALKQVVDILPIIDTTISSLPFADGYVVEYKKGKAIHIRCFNSQSDECISIVSEIYVHRKYPTLLVQKIIIRNPLDRPVDVSFIRKELSTERTEQLNNSEVGQVLSLSIPAAQSGHSSVVSAVMPKMPQKVSIKAKSSETHRFLTVIDYSEVTDKGMVTATQKSNEERVIEMAKEYHQIAAGDLDKAHETVCTQLWLAGFSVSWSHAPAALNSDLINATRYAVLCNSPAPLHEHQKLADNQKLIDEAKLALKKSELCYNAHHTMMFPSRLWSALSNADEIVHTAYLWRLTLEKGGCTHLVQAGADGISQAMVLSFGGLKFTQHHLEFHMHPMELHRDYWFENVLYEGAYIRIRVLVQEDNHAMLQAAVSAVPAHVKAPPTFFACDAGCLDTPQQLKSVLTSFPVKLTEPLTPILYVTSDKSHLNDLKHTIHVREVAEAPAHEHHVLALHRHGHRLGGLPAIFWVGLVLLIAAFHCFLFKLVYSEWTRTSGGAGVGGFQNRYSHGRARYSN